MITVLHNRSFLDAGRPRERDGKPYVPNVDELYPVADLYGYDLDDTYSRTQNITGSWAKAPLSRGADRGIAKKYDGENHRSTSVGDVLILFKPCWSAVYVVASVGFEQWYEMDAHALYEMVKDRTKGSLGPLIETREEDFRSVRL
jgi:hypothetical protein